MTQRKQKPYSVRGHQRAITAGAFAGYVGGGALGGGIAGGAAAARGTSGAEAAKAIRRGARAGRVGGTATGALAGHRAYVKRHSNPDGSPRVPKQTAHTKRVAARSPAQLKKRHQRQRRAGYAAAGGAVALARLGAVSSRQTKVAGEFHKLGGVRANKVPAHKANFSRPGRATYRKHGTPIFVKSHHQRAIGTGHGRQHRDRRGRFA